MNRNTSPNTKRVSVVVANYNMGRFVRQAVHSVLAQTYPVHEIIVVDDGSSDNSSEELQEFSGHPSVRVIFQRNGGQAKAKNRGILEATGDFIGFCDADDMWTPTKLERQLPVFDEDPLIGVVHTNFVRISVDGAVLGTPSRQYYDGWIAGRLLVDNFVNGMASVVRRECFNRVGVFDESLPMGIDYDLWLRISPHYMFRFIDERAYLYRQWEGQMSHRHQKRFECAVRIMTRFIQEHPDAVDSRTRREAWAHTFVSRGEALRDVELRRSMAYVYFLKALREKPDYLPAWKAILRTMLVYS